jgi:flavin reductase (DIM6/NTAB) family NADH-FMN oxidoreductase RutF
MELRHDMLTHGVYVVCAEHQGRRGGLAIAWATQAGIDSILICVGKQSATRELILDSGAFGLSALAREQLEVARLFGRQSSQEVDKFETVGYHTSVTGSPLLNDCGLTLDCRIMAVHDLDTKKLIVGRIEAAERLRDVYEPLVYREEDY